MATDSGGGPVEQRSAAERAYLAGFPLVTTVRTMQTFAGITGINKLLRVPRLSNAGTKLVVAPNHDTMYALAVLDLRGGPQALTVPTIDRYHTFQFIDAWMQTIANVGTRATGGKAGTWVVLPPGYEGAVPKDLHTIESPTNQVFVLGRIRAVDDADAAQAMKDSDGLKLEPLSTITGGPAQPAPPPIGKPAGAPQTVDQAGIEYWDELGDDLAVNPPVNDEQRKAIDGAASLGVGAGKHPSTTATPTQKAELDAGQAKGNEVIADPSHVGGKDVNGWEVNLTLGDPQAHPTLDAQAIIAKHYWGPNVSEESVYPVLRTASDGKPLDGSKDYVIHLAKDQLPPVNAFWSYTVYGQDGFFYDNPLNRYSLSGDSPGLVTNPDGSVDIYLSHEAPAGHEANWIPTPNGPYQLVMRLYLPKDPVLKGTYEYPPVTVAG